ncbi:adenylate kinase isoenzyme 1-like [Paramacrobiotus metropolitanus]|uniref:adenylate kinase isoenzyme 1-like n=1 Tax=Paramacrobiotus metropolitanus TaxID=2943436 RepID=UPI0024462CBB|nr:adenylate kinase isoenzyme 1-like [Paramacrobiotus metropolitanus]
MDENQPTLDLNLNLLQRTREPVIFVIGGPGSGKATQCKQLAEDFDMHHISMGQAIRDTFRKGQTDHANRLQEAYDKGGMVPLDEAMYVLKATMTQRLQQASKPFIIHGFPRYLHQAVQYEREIGFPRAVILLEADDEIMKSRLTDRSKTSRRPDDVHEAVENRLTWFHSCVAELAHYYGPHNKLYTVDANRPVKSIYKDISQVVEIWV